MTTERSVPPFLHFLPDQRLDGGTVQSLPSRLADLLVRYPAPQGVFHLLGCAEVIGKLGADYDGGIPVLLGEVEANAATGADFGYAPVRV